MPVPKRREPRTDEDAEDSQGSPFVAWFVACAVTWAIIGLLIWLVA
jgi:hypothetical protein